MKQIGLIFSIFSLLLSSCGGNKEDVAKDAPRAELAETRTVYQPTITALQYEDLLTRLQTKDDTLYVVNFWATWCLPCVKELPYFVSTAKAMSNNPLKLVLVNLDTKDEMETKVIPFLKAKNFEATHFLLDDNGRMNEWIPKFDANWDGAIPATVLYKNGEQLRFTSGQISEQELKEQINTYLTQ